MLDDIDEKFGFVKPEPPAAPEYYPDEPFGRVKSYAFPSQPKRINRDFMQSANGFKAGEPQSWAKSPHFDRFAVDCLYWLCDLGMPLTVEGIKAEIAFANKQQNARVPYEAIRMLLPFIVPVLVFFSIKAILIPSAFWFPAITAVACGYALHRNISRAMASKIPPRSLLLTTYLTRQNLTLQDIEANPSILRDDYNLSLHLQRYTKFQLSHLLARHSASSLPNGQGRGMKKLLMPYIGAKTAYNPVLVGLINMYNVCAYRLTGGGSYAPMQSNYDHSNNHSVFDNAGMPQFNTNGMPMIPNSGIDVQGHVYGSNDQF